MKSRVGQYLQDHRTVATTLIAAMALLLVPAGASAADTGGISGKVTDASSKAPIEGVNVCAYEANTEYEDPSEEGALVKCSSTNANGEYTLTGLAGGSYKVKFEPPFNSNLDYIAQYYNDKSSFSEATEVSVTEGRVTAAVNAALTREITATPEPPENSMRPVVSGGSLLGGFVTCSLGVWLHTPTNYTSQWLRDGMLIQGASENSYTLQSKDVGQSLSCTVTAENAAGKASATSASVRIQGGGSSVIAPAPLLKLTSSKLIASQKSVTVDVRCTKWECIGSIELTMGLTVKGHKRSRKGSRKETLVLAKGLVFLAKGKKAAIVLHLTALGRGRLAHAELDPLAAKLTVSLNAAKTTSKPVLVR